jgi:SecD/SecF fusion protein
MLADLSTPLSALVVVLAAFVIPGFLAWVMTRRLRLEEDYGWKIFLVLFCIGVSSTILAFKEPRLGIDLMGGVNLVYGLEDLPGQSAANVDIEGDLVGPLRQRIDPSGLQEITVRSFGGQQVEIIMPAGDQADSDALKEKLENTGSLSFQILADPADHQGLIQRAKRERQQNIRRITNDAGNVIAEWVPIYVNPRTNDLAVQRVPEGNSIEVDGRTEVLLIVEEEGQQIDGDLLDSAYLTTDERGGWAVGFRFNTDGSYRFGRLTGDHLPRPGVIEYQLGIVLDGELYSAPGIKSRIEGRGIISGDFSQAEVEELITVLKAGAMPARLVGPLKEEVTGPLLGADLIFNGSVAIGAALALVLLFMLVYYRFAGIVACVAMALNILFVLGVMFAFDAVFTLPGLAGLVLTVGMAIDANVLIYERLREELERGATLRMAIRNGYAKATTTIIDANLTTLITATVLYVIGTDQVKGFAITLWLGIALSMFTAVFVTRLIFDIAEKRFKLRELNMMKMMTKTNFDFLGHRHAAMVLSALVIAGGLFATVLRGETILDIDFLGGSSVQVRFQEPQSRPEIQSTILAMPEFESVSVKAVRSYEETSETGFLSDTAQTFVVDALLTQEARDKAVEMFGSEVAEQAESEAEDTAANETAEEVDADEAAAAKEAQRDRENQAAYVRFVERLLNDAFGDRLVHNAVTASSVTALPGGTSPAPETPAAGTTPPADPMPMPETTAEPMSETPMTEAPMSEAPATPMPEGSPQSSLLPSFGGLLFGVLQAEEAPAAEEQPAAETPAEPTGTPPATQEPEVEVDSYDKIYAGGARAEAEFAQAIAPGRLTGFLVESATERGIDASGQGFVAMRNLDEGKNDGQPGRRWRIWTRASAEQLEGMMADAAAKVGELPYFPFSSGIGRTVAANSQQQAIEALVVSLLAIVGYIWFRFSRISYGVAAVVALVHDVLVMLGALAVSAYVAQIPYVESVIGITTFKLNLPVIAAFLTVIGYSLNDTIVVFDRVREVKGKSPHLTIDMLNTSLNATLSRTVLTGITTLLVVVVLFFAGVDSLKAFAFCLIVGVIVGTYSSVFIACPVLIWLGEAKPAPTNRTPPSDGKKAQLAS